MSDVGLGNLNTSALAAPSALAPATQGVDASATDLSLRAIRHVESTWAMPALPDEVKLDLASLPGGHPAVSSLLHGISNDINGNQVDPSALQTLPDLTMQSSVSDFSPEARSTFDDARVFMASLRGEAPPTAPDDFAVQKWKVNAIQKGFLQAPSDGVVDGSWDPSYNSVRSQMAFSAANDQRNGDRAGALPLGKTLQLIGDWTSPSGLLRAATHLDLWWDTGQISKDFSSWGDKWRKVGHSSGPFDFAKNLLDAVVGPIGDIAVPAINLALLFTGVSEVFNFAKVGMMAADGIAAGEAIADAGKIYRLPGIGRLVQAASSAADVEKFGEAGWMSSKLAASGGEIRGGISDAMDAWRNFTPVQDAKKVVQAGMRLGFANQVERNVLGYKGDGGSASDIPGVNSAVDTALGSRWSMAGEALLTPIHLFEPGSFVSGAKDLGSFALRQLGSAPGRAVAGGIAGAGWGAFQNQDAGQVAKDAAIGAAAGAVAPVIGKAITWGTDHIPLLDHLPGLETVGNVLRKTSFAPIADDQRIAGAFYNATVQHLTSLTQQGDAAAQTAASATLQQFQDTAAKSGFKQAWADLYHGGDTELGGAAMKYQVQSAAIDKTARMQAGEEASAGYERNVLIAKGKLTAQSRPFDIQNGNTAEDVVWAAASRESNSPFDNKREYDRLWQKINEGDDPEAAIRRVAEMANQHNMMVNETQKQLMSVENMPELAGTPNMGKWQGLTPDARVGALQNYLVDVAPTFGKWTTWQPITHDVEDLVKGGLLQDARFSNAVGWDGDYKNVQTTFDGVTAAEGSQDITRQINQHLMFDPGFNVATYGQTSRFAPLARQIQAFRGKFNIMKEGTVSKQEMLLAADELDGAGKSMVDFQRLNKKLIDVPKNITVEDAANLPAGTPLTSPKSVWDIAGGSSFRDLGNAEFVQSLQAAGVGADDIKSLQRLRRYAAAKGLTGEDFGTALDAHAKDILNDDRWSQRFNLPTQVRGEDNVTLQGGALLQAKAKQLTQKSMLTAAEIDKPSLLADISAKFGENSPELRQATTTIDHLEASGYKLVHGSEFMMPSDVMHYSGEFNDINERNLNAMTLGNFFKRQVPEVLQQQVRTAQRTSILNRLNDPTVNHGLNLAGGTNSADMDKVMSDLYTYVIKPAQDRSEMAMADVQNQQFLSRAWTRLGTNSVPVSVQDLGLNSNRRNVVSVLTNKGYNEAAANAIWTGIKEGRFADFKSLGFAAFEAKMRSRNQLTDALTTLAGTKEGSGFLSMIPKGKGSMVVGGAVGAAVGANENSGPDATWSDILQGGIKGAAVGAIAGKAASTLLNAPLTKAADMFEHSKFARYGYLADNLAATRDFMRFTVNPFFDARRYVHNHFLAQGSGVDELPLNLSPRALKSQFRDDITDQLSTSPIKDDFGPVSIATQANQRFNDVQNDFRKVAMPHFDPATLESTGQYFRKVGVLGFDPTAWQASAWYQLQQTGKFTAEQAFDKVKDMYAYGTTGRSAAEQSVNFLFFPFSFQKNAMTHAAQFMADDLSRAAMIHDAYKTYHELDKQYNIGEELRQHAPALQQLQQLNLFSHGVSPGTFGGINAHLFDSVGGAVLNLFSPQGVSINNAKDGAKLQDLMGSVIPAINDVHQLITNMMAQKHVLYDPSHEISASQARDGYKAWGDYKTGIYAALKDKGYKPGDLTARPELAPLNTQFEAKRSEIGTQYPGWLDSKINAAKKNVTVQAERQQRTDAVAAGSLDPTNQQFVAMELYIKQYKDYLKKDLGVTSIADAPPETYDKVRGVAREMLTANPDFQQIWDKFYSHEFGPLTAAI